MKNQLPTASRRAFWDLVLPPEEMEEPVRRAIMEHIAERTWKPLGKILIEDGYMNIKQVSHLLQIQANDMSMRIGDLAVREGYCTPRELQEAIDFLAELGEG